MLRTSGSAGVHAELRTLARVLPRGVGRPAVVKLSRLLTPVMGAGLLARGVEVERIGDISVRMHRPRQAPPGPLPALLWIHGGGFVIGHPAQDDRVCRAYADELGAIVCAVDYRLAPEHPYPTPLHDCHDALVWLAGRDDVDADRIAIGGASAGGGLAAGLALLARDRGEVTPAFQLLIYPMLDDRTTRRRDVDETHFRLWDNRSNRYGWTSYLGHAPGDDAADGYAAPARQDDLAGLPPVWLGVGTQDLFHDEDLAYAERLAAAGVPCDVVIVEGAFHAFDTFGARTKVARAFWSSQIEAMRSVISPTG